MAEVFCNKCDEFFDIEIDTHLLMEMDGDSFDSHGKCPICGDECFFRTYLHWKPAEGTEQADQPDKEVKNE